MIYTLNEYTDDQSFFGQYPTDSEIKECLKNLHSQKERLEQTHISGLDETFGYAQVKRNIAYLNNQLREGTIYYNTEPKLVLISNDDEIVADTYSGPPGGQMWKLLNGRTLRVFPSAWSYYEHGYRVKVMIAFVETYFIPEQEKSGELKNITRALEVDFTNLPEPNNILLKNNLK